jgi:integrase
MERPGIAPRTKIVTRDQASTILASIRDESFRNFPMAMMETGARPSEMMRVEAAHLDLPNSRILMPGKTSRKTRKPRIIYLSAAAAELFSSLAAIHPTGPLLLNLRGKPWTRNALTLRFQRLRDKLGMGSEATAESFRHLFITDCLERGLSNATVAELAGHQSTAMIDQRYSHLHDRHEHLLQAVQTVRPGDEPDGPKTDG